LKNRRPELKKKKIALNFYQIFYLQGAERDADKIKK